MSSCFKDITSASHLTMVKKTEEVPFTGPLMITSSVKAPQTDGLLNPDAPMIKMDDKCQTAASDVIPHKPDAASIWCQGTAANPLSNTTAASSSMKTFVEKDSQSCSEERNTENTTKCGREGRVTHPGATTDEKSVYVSKMELGLLSPTGSSVPHFPSEQEEVQVEARERVPQMIMLLPSCPRYSEIPGVAYLHHSPLRAWHDEGRSLVHKLRSSGLPSLLYSDLHTSALGEYCGITKMVTSTLSCTEPGSPPTVTYDSEIPLLVSTCPQSSRTPGLPSVKHLTRHQQSVWDRGSLWRKLFQVEETFGFLFKDHTATDTDLVRRMATMLPTCPRKARVPGFPSVWLQKALTSPSVACLLPTCPTQTTVAGMPFRVKVLLSLDSWHMLRKYMINKTLRNSSVVVDQFLFPFCQWKAVGPHKEHSVVSLPPTPQHPSMVDFVPSCPRKSRVLGLPSKEFISYQNNSNLIEDLVHRVCEDAPGDSEKRELSEMVAMMPSCPVRTYLLGMPSCPHKGLSNQVSVQPKEAQTPDTGSQVVPDLRDWHAFSQVIKRADKTTQVVIHPLEDTVILKDMVDMSSRCPNKATVFGLPSAPPHKACVVNLIPSCPRSSKIFGWPSKATQTPVTCTHWFNSTKIQWPSRFNKTGVQIHNADSSLDKNTIQMMTATRPSCPVVAGVPGFPSVLMLTHGPKMVNSSHCYTKESRVPGMPRGCSTKQINWTMERRPPLLPQKRSRSHSLDVSSHHWDVPIGMLSTLSSCPNVACFPGFPSVSCQTLAAIPNVTSLLPTCSRQSALCGIPSRLFPQAGEGEWLMDEKPLWGKPLSLSGGLLSIQMIDDREKGLLTVMLSMLPPCPKRSTITGIPSKRKETPVQTYSMLGSLGMAPNFSKILGIPAKKSANEGWAFGQSTVVAEPLSGRVTVVHINATFKELSDKDKQNMWRILPLCPVLTPGHPLVPPPAEKEEDADMIKVRCPRCSSITGFPSRTCVTSRFYPGCWPELLIHKQERPSHRVVMSDTHYEPCSLSGKLASMANIGPSCPTSSFVLGLMSRHVHGSGQGWPGGVALLQEAPGTKEERENKEDVQQTNASAACPLLTSDQGSPRASCEVQVDQSSPSVSGMCEEVSRGVLETDRKSTPSSPQALDTHPGFWMSSENEEGAVMGPG